MSLLKLFLSKKLELKALGVKAFVYIKYNSKP